MAKRGEVDDRKPRVAEADTCTLLYKNPCIVWPPMPDRC